MKDSITMRPSGSAFVGAACLALSIAACVPSPEAPPDGLPATGGSHEELHVPISPALVVHGGAGALRREEMPAELEAAYRSALTEALEIGYATLEEGESALDAVERTLRYLEDSPLFNAGKGAVFTRDGRNELDASIMAGDSRQAGAVAAVTTVRNPISAARAVMERSPHVLLAGPGAEAFAAEAGLEIVDPGYFHTERRWRQLQEQLAREAEGSHFGTVGAVALDRQGRIAAGTSTGGTSRKLPGRLGDSPIIGAGTWADEHCGVSSTGHGEFFIRYGVAHEICARARLAGLSVAEAAEQVVNGLLVEAGGEGGVVALDAAGTPVLAFNSAGMYRGWIVEGEPRVAIFRDE